MRVVVVAREQPLEERGVEPPSQCVAHGGGGGGSGCVRNDVHGTAAAVVADER